MIFVDIETTGLKADECAILSIGIAIVSAKLEIVDSFEGFVIPPIFDSPAWTKWAWDTHTRTGLLDQCYAEGLTLSDVERAALAFLGKYDHRPDAPMNDRPAMFGNSLRLDRDFLERHTPTLASCFHYRSGDVSAVRVIVDALGLPQWPGTLVPEDQIAHKAKADIEKSVEQLAWYRDHVFKPAR